MTLNDTRSPEEMRGYSEGKLKKVLVPGSTYLKINNKKSKYVTGMAKTQECKSIPQDTLHRKQFKNKTNI